MVAGALELLYRRRLCGRFDDAPEEKQCEELNIKLKRTTMCFPDGHHWKRSTQHPKPILGGNV